MKLVKEESAVVAGRTLRAWAQIDLLACFLNATLFVFRGQTCVPACTGPRLDLCFGAGFVWFHVRPIRSCEELQWKALLSAWLSGTHRLQFDPRTSKYICNLDCYFMSHSHLFALILHNCIIVLRRHVKSCICTCIGRHRCNCIPLCHLCIDRLCLTPTLSTWILFQVYAHDMGACTYVSDAIVYGAYIWVCFKEVFDK